MENRLYRNRDDRIICGVCGGLAKYFDIDPVIVRIVTVLLALANGAGILAYIILAIVIPLESSSVTEPGDVIKENIEEMKETATKLGNDIRSTFVREKDASTETAKTRHGGRDVFGIILIVIGVLFLLASFNLMWWLRWQYLWPIIPIAIGLLIIFGARRK
ncbi:PspC domain-containing protein [Chloroflexota bacterium]